jgi:general secretion pathway protein J
MSGLPGAVRPLRTGAAGFTRVELLVVMTLMSLIALAMAGAMRTMAQVEGRVDARLLRTDDLRVAAGFIRSTLGRVSLRKLEPPPPLGQNLYLFAAGPEALTWVGVMPARPGAGGRNVFRLALETVESGPALVIRFAPMPDTAAIPDWTGAESRVLLQEVTGFSIAYQDGRQSPAEWLAQWSVPDRLPARVKLSVQTSSGGWPDLVIPLRVLPAGARGTGATFGGGGDDVP